MSPPDSQSIPATLALMVESLRTNGKALHPTVAAELLLTTIRARVRELPEDGATSSRDYGRGYAQAVKDVLALLQ